MAIVIMFDTVEEVNSIFEGILNHTRKIMYQDDHILYGKANKYSRTSRKLTSGRRVQFYIHQLALLYKMKTTQLD